MIRTLSIELRTYEVNTIKTYPYDECALQIQWIDSVAYRVVFSSLTPHIGQHSEDPLSVD